MPSTSSTEREKRRKLVEPHLASISILPHRLNTEHSVDMVHISSRLIALANPKIQDVLLFTCRLAAMQLCNGLPNVTQASLWLQNHDGGMSLVEDAVMDLWLMLQRCSDFASKDDVHSIKLVAAATLASLLPLTYRWQQAADISDFWKRLQKSAPEPGGVFLLLRAMGDETAAKQRYSKRSLTQSKASQEAQYSDNADFRKFVIELLGAVLLHPSAVSSVPFPTIQLALQKCVVDVIGEPSYKARDFSLQRVAMQVLVDSAPTLAAATPGSTSLPDLLAAAVGKLPKTAARVAQLSSAPAKDAMKQVWQSSGAASAPSSPSPTSMSIIPLWDKHTSLLTAQLVATAIAFAPNAKAAKDAALALAGHRDPDVLIELVSSLIDQCLSASSRQSVVELLFSGVDDSLLSSTSNEGIFCFGQFVVDNILTYCARASISCGRTASFTPVNIVRVVSGLLLWLLTTFKFFEVDGLTTQKFPPSISTWFDDPLRVLLHSLREAFPMSAENAASVYGEVMKAEGLVAVLKVGETVLLSRGDNLTSEQHLRQWFPDVRDFLNEVRQLDEAVLKAAGGSGRASTVHMVQVKQAANVVWQAVDQMTSAVRKSKMFEEVENQALLQQRQEEESNRQHAEQQDLAIGATIDRAPIVAKKETGGLHSLLIYCAETFR